MINPDEQYEGEDQSVESTESAEIDYKSGYEKEKAEAERWRNQFLRRDSEYRAQHGQLAPAQKELARLKELEKSIKAKKQTPAEWDAFERDFPQEAKAHNARLTPFEKRMEEMERRYEELQKSSSERDRIYSIKERFNNVKAAHPDFMEVVGSKEFAEFGMGLPRAVRQAFENREDPDDEVHIHVLNLFKKEYANSKPANQKADYVKSQGLAPRAKQTQSGSGADGSSDPAEQAFLNSLAYAKKQARSN